MIAKRAPVLAQILIAFKTFVIDEQRISVDSHIIIMMT